MRRSPEMPDGSGVPLATGNYACPSPAQHTCVAIAPIFRATLLSVSVGCADRTDFCALPSGVPPATYRSEPLKQPLHVIVAIALA